MLELQRECVMNVMCAVYDFFMELFCDWKRVIDSSGNKTALFLAIIILIHLGVL